METDDIYRCRVCGILVPEPPWGENGKQSSHNICVCCGTEFGYEDGLLEAARKARKKWLAKGAPWFTPRFKPDDWDLEEQLKHIPAEWR